MILLLLLLLLIDGHRSRGARGRRRQLALRFLHKGQLSHRLRSCSPPPLLLSFASAASSIFSQNPPPLPFRSLGCLNFPRDPRIRSKRRSIGRPLLLLRPQHSQPAARRGGTTTRRSRPLWRRDEHVHVRKVARLLACDAKALLSERSDRGRRRRRASALERNERGTSRSQRSLMRSKK